MTVTAVAQIAAGISCLATLTTAQAALEAAQADCYRPNLVVNGGFDAPCGNLSYDSADTFPSEWQLEEKTSWQFDHWLRVPVKPHSGLYSCSTQGGPWVIALSSLSFSLCAPGYKFVNEPVSQTVNNLEVGVEYAVRFEQTTAAVGEAGNIQGNGGFWRVTFGETTLDSPVVAGVGLEAPAAPWTYTELRFIATAASQLLEFKAFIDVLPETLTSVSVTQSTFMAIDDISVSVQGVCLTEPTAAQPMPTAEPADCYRPDLVVNGGFDVPCSGLSSLSDYGQTTIMFPPEWQSSSIWPGDYVQETSSWVDHWLAIPVKPWMGVPRREVPGSC